MRFITKELKLSQHFHKFPYLGTTIFLQHPIESVRVPALVQISNGCTDGEPTLSLYVPVLEGIVRH